MSEQTKFYSGKSVLVTGGAGFIGSHLVRRLLKMGCEVIVADDLSRGSLENLDGYLKQIDFHRANLTDFRACKRVTENVDYVFHLASPVGGIQFIKTQNVANLSPALLMHTNMIEAARMTDVERFLFASSACVYFERNTMMNEFREEDAYPANPPTTYGWAKVAGEKLCEAYYNDYGMKSSAVRIFNAFGENENLDPRWSHVIPSLIRKAILYPEGDFVVFGDGTQERAFLYVKDCVEGLTRVMKIIDNGEPINLGGSELTSIRSLASAIIDLSGKQIPIRFDPTGPRGVNRYCANLSRLNEKLRWTPRTSLRHGLENTFKWVEGKLESNSRTLMRVARTVP